MVRGRMRAGRPLSRFRRDDAGASSVELVVWLPFFPGMFFLLVDTSVTFSQHART